jgi:hypothetical protein
LGHERRTNVFIELFVGHRLLTLFPGVCIFQPVFCVEIARQGLVARTQTSGVRNGVSVLIRFVIPHRVHVVARGSLKRRATLLIIVLVRLISLLDFVRE